MCMAVYRSGTLPSECDVLLWGVSQVKTIGDKSEEQTTHWIASKFGYVIMHPSQGQGLILESKILRARFVTKRKDVQSIL